MIDTLIKSKVMVSFLLVSLEIGSAFFNANQLNRGAINAMESALKEVDVTLNNDIVVNESRCINTLNRHLQSNLKLDNTLSPIKHESLLVGRIEIVELQIYDVSRNTMPVAHDGKTFVHPTMHIVLKTSAKPAFASFLNLPLSYPLTLHLDESNEPPQ